MNHKTRPARFGLLAAGLLALGVLAIAAGKSEPAKAAAGDYKIGVVNIKEVFDAYEKQEDEYAELERERDERQKVIDQISTKIEASQKRHTELKAAPSPSADEILALEEEIASDFGRYQAEFKRLQDEIDRREKKLLESLFNEIHEAVGEVGVQSNYHLILEGGRTGRSGVLYSSTTLNMTRQIIDSLNASYKKS